MENVEKLEIEKTLLFQIKISDFNEKAEELRQWLSSSEQLPVKLQEIIRESSREISLEEFLKGAKKKLFNSYGDKRDKAKSFADSRFTPIDQMVERGMVSCGAMTNIFGTLLREMGVPVRFVHGSFLKEDKNKESRHSWLEIYNPLSNVWFEIDPTHPEFGMRPESKRIRVYHDWAEMKKDYDRGDF